MELSKKYQSRLNNGMKVAYSGVEGAFAHIASMKMFKNATYVAYKDFETAYKACLDGECDTCVLPIENSVAGEVGNVMDLVFSGSLYINQVMGAWNNFSTTQIYLHSYPNLAYGIYNRLNKKMDPQFFAAVFISSLVPLTLFGAFQKTMMTNMSVGGLKG